MPPCLRALGEDGGGRDDALQVCGVVQGRQVSSLPDDLQHLVVHQDRLGDVLAMHHAVAHGCHLLLDGVRVPPLQVVQDIVQRGRVVRQGFLWSSR